jgi:hypothetical protein
LVDSALIKHFKKRKVNPLAIERFEELISFLEKNEIGFYDSEWPVIRERNEGSQQYVDVTISIRTS